MAEITEDTIKKKRQEFIDDIKKTLDELQTKPKTNFATKIREALNMARGR